MSLVCGMVKPVHLAAACVVERSWKNWIYPLECFPLNNVLDKRLSNSRRSTVILNSYAMIKYLLRHFNKMPENYWREIPWRLEREEINYKRHNTIYSKVIQVNHSKVMIWQRLKFTDVKHLVKGTKVKLGYSLLVMKSVCVRACVCVLDRLKW